jgi:SAM-dependent methyltransferase
MDRAYAQVYRELYEGHWWWRARERLVMNVLGRLTLPGPERRILDVGCGDALLFPRLAPFGEVYGVEIDAPLVAEDNPLRHRIHLGPFDDSFTPDGKFDLILMLDVLEHMPDARQALARAASLLTPGGKLVITVPAFNALWTNHDRINQHRTRYTRPMLRDEAASAGFVLEESFYCFHWMIPAKLAVRAIEALGWGSEGPAEIPSPAVNALALRLSLIEQRWLGPLRLPVGSSLFSVLALPQPPR